MLFRFGKIAFLNNEGFHLAPSEVAGGEHLVDVDAGQVIDELNIVDVLAVAVFPEGDVDVGFVSIEDSRKAFGDLLDVGIRVGDNISDVGFLVADPELVPTDGNARVVENETLDFVLLGHGFVGFRNTCVDRGGSPRGVDGNLFLLVNGLLSRSAFLHLRSDVLGRSANFQTGNARRPDSRQTLG